MRIKVVKNEDEEITLAYLEFTKREIELALRFFIDNDLDGEDIGTVRLDRNTELQLMQLMGGERVGWDNDATTQDLLKSSGITTEVVQKDSTEANTEE